MTRGYEHLGGFSDLVNEARKQRELYPPAPPGPETQRRVRDVLGFFGPDEEPGEPRVERRWENDGLQAEEVSWSIGYGPRTHGWVLKPVGADQPLPGVLALHGHDGFKFSGKEKVADGPDGAPEAVGGLRASMYSGRAFANELAKRGFVVLAHDAFSWGSRGFPLEDMPDTTRQVAGESHRTLSAAGDASPEEVPEDVSLYNAAALHHEHLLEKYCRLLGTTLAGVVAYEDRVAASYLSSRADVAPESLGCAGLSGGGCRATLLQATCDEIAAAVVVGMMSTYEHLLDGIVDPHTWMLFPDGWPRHGDWPDLAACRAPSPLMVQYPLDDHLFPKEGMKEAHWRIAAHYRGAGRAEAYAGRFYEGPHRFDAEMQDEAFAWLEKTLQA